MAKFSTLISFLLILLVFTCEEKVRIIEAKDCHKVWDCKGDHRCWEDCKAEYSGKGMCDLYTTPDVPKQCFCAYKC
ncbi:low-molecular-weight cysteine-rich [Parasponia andersonii]|uniref:Low-molecular-weight cysteine-rich n=1 Tax=Parasponia andersonii TaxID=3476 RepID=A0A2P5DKZ4_PARAD|nr:low-molecular-weight cysteine-rich [Parasponia andersonii]